MFSRKESNESVNVSTRSLQNLNRELSAIGNIVGTMDDLEDIMAFVNEALEEVRYNIGLLPEGVEYRSDEYSFIFESSMRECV